LQSLETRRCSRRIGPLLPLVVAGREYQRSKKVDVAVGGLAATATYCGRRKGSRVLETRLSGGSSEWMKLITLIK
jgi:putative hemolysin